MKTYKELLEAKKPDYTITIKHVKDSRKAIDLLRKDKIKFSDESQTLLVFKKEDQWDAAMELLDEYDIDYDFDG